MSQTRTAKKQKKSNPGLSSAASDTKANAKVDVKTEEGVIATKPADGETVEETVSNEAATAKIEGGQNTKNKTSDEKQQPENLKRRSTDESTSHDDCTKSETKDETPPIAKSDPADNNELDQDHGEDSDPSVESPEVTTVPSTLDWVSVVKERVAKAEVMADSFGDWFRSNVSASTWGLNPDPIVESHSEPESHERSQQKIGGVAPYVGPGRRPSQRRGPARKIEGFKHYRRGFVPLSPGKVKIRHRILPRTVIGISFMLLATAVGAAFSGAGFYAYYDNRLAENEKSVELFVDGFDQQFRDAAGSIDSLRVDAISEIRSELALVGDIVTDANGVIELPKSAGRSVWSLETRDEDGRRVLGSAFAVATHAEGTAFVTSLSLVEASTTAPSPEILVSKGGEVVQGQLWSWDDERDLALIVVGREVAPLKLASANQQVESIGTRVFALSGSGGQGSTASPGVLLDASSNGLQHTAPIGNLFAGGPIVTGDSKVVGVASLGYQPFGVEHGAIPQAPDIMGLCSRILICPDNGLIEVVAPEPEAPRAESVLVGEATGEAAPGAEETTDAEGTSNAEAEPLPTDGG